MKTVLSAILAAGIACALPVTLTSTAVAGSYGYGDSGGGYAPIYHPKAYYPPKTYAPPPAYSGDYPPQGCTGDLIPIRGKDDKPLEAKAAGKLNELPVNHSPQFAPVLHPTLETGVEALVVGVMAWLGAS